MKRDMDVIRSILLQVEGAEGGMHSTELDLNNVSDGVRDYHVRLLYDAGVIEGIDASSMSGFVLMDLRLNWIGHDFLDSIRDQGIWDRVKLELKKVGGDAPIEIVKALAIEAIKKTLGLGSET